MRALNPNRGRKMSESNPRKWRFTWETQSHTPNLKLFLFASHTTPSIHCGNLQVGLNFLQSHLLVSWTEGGDAENKAASVRVPIPKVLIDPESQVSFRALDDHIEVKLLLLLPVDHPIVSSFDFVLNLSGDEEENAVSDGRKAPTVDSDLKSLSAKEGVHFYCRNCSTRLTTSPLRSFVEMPSVDWRELADNWFGACCCSFGGVSEKLVNNYADAYSCAKGVCLLNITSVTVFKDDVIGFKSVGQDEIQKDESKQDFVGENGLSEDHMLRPKTTSGGVAGYVIQNEKLLDENGELKACCKFEDLGHKVMGEAPCNNGSLCELPTSRPECCSSTHHAQGHINEVSNHDLSKPFKKNLKGMELLERCLLNGFLGNIFVARSYNLSKDIEWKQFFCPQCSSLLGAYPCANGDVHIDDGVRFFKCFLSTSLTIGGSGDLFRKYTLERMFVNELVESAKDELSFRTVVRDLATKSPQLQVVLLNPNSWCCSGICLETERTEEKAQKLDLHPVIKFLFADCNNLMESQSSVLESWMKNKLADEVFMFTHLHEQLKGMMVSAKDAFPLSCTNVQGLSLSYMLK